MPTSPAARPGRGRGGQPRGLESLLAEDGSGTFSRSTSSRAGSRPCWSCAARTSSRTS